MQPEGLLLSKAIQWYSRKLYYLHLQGWRTNHARNQQVAGNKKKLFLDVMV
jgi:hypothetical protein